MCAQLFLFVPSAAFGTQINIKIGSRGAEYEQNHACRLEIASGKFILIYFYLSWLISRKPYFNC